MHTLKIKNLSVEVDGKMILHDFNLEIKSGEIHAIMGPNGTGKSTLSKTIMGDKNYHIKKGSITFDEKELNDLTVDERARLGIFLGMQMPLEIEGVSNADFMRSAVRAKDGDHFKLYPFIKKMDEVVKELKMDPEMIHRSVNQGFSGGERKKNEILQMYLLEPKLIMLDEIDSGLDVDSLKVVGESVMRYYEEKHPAILLITHYQRLLDYIKPTHVHIMVNGTIVKSADASLVSEVEKYGYEKVEKKYRESIGACAIEDFLKHE